ncbi:acid-sensing ion channel 4 isoform X2 [Engystomops pustulosus]|uniref:acid-sensing ion channel 4 isoform X2 n=1 Tax=Engystomops pustulosus TaxID=76066 RepID=UPI003AFA6028
MGTDSDIGAIRSSAETTDKFLKTTKLHGLFHLRASFSLRHRLFFGAMFITALGLLISYSLEHVYYLMSRPTITNVKMTWVRKLQFPAVTICRVRQRNGITQYPQMSSPLGQESPIDELGLPGLSDHSWKDLDRMMVKCFYRGRYCTSQDFTPVYTRYGKCYTFNADKNNPKVTRQGGMGNGLEIMLDIQQEEYLPIWRETNETSFEAGIRVQIHSQDEPPYIHQLGFGVSPGFQTFVSCQEQRLTYLPQPWGNCRATAPAGDFLPGYSTYSISACRLQCEKEAVVKSCSCRMVHMPGNETICPPSKYISCADTTLDILVENNDKCTCPTPCNMTRYGKEISMVRIPNKGSARYLAKKYNKNETYIRDNFLVLDIFFEALNYGTIEQKKAYDLASLLGDIGGQMGLFIGASILTILEILDYLYELIRDKVNKLFRRKPSPTRKPKENISTLAMDDLNDQSTSEVRGRHPEGAYANTMLPNHHRHYTHHGVFEDFAC